MAEGFEVSAASGLRGLYENYRPELLRFMAARCGDPAEAEDLIQELWLKLADLKVGPVANGKAYLFRMANNLALDRVRGRQRAMRRDRSWIDRDPCDAAAIEDRPDPALDAEKQLLVEEEANVLREAIASLPEGARSALVAFRFEGLQQGEIADRMGISRSGVEKHLALAMKRLRNHLDDCGYFATATSDNREWINSSNPTMEKTK